MTSLQIAYFLKTAQCMSFSQAAQELYVSQPSVSRQIRLLEQELGCRLLDRTRKNAITLTAEGMIYRETFHRTQQQLAAARSAAQAAAGQPSLRLRAGIGMYWDMTDQLLQFRAQVRQLYPQAQIQFESHDFLEMRRQLQAGTMDCMVCTKTSLLDFAGLDVIQIANLESRAYVRRGLLRPAEEPLRVEDFNGQQLLMLSETESPMAMELAQLRFQAHQVTVTPVWLPNRDTILQALLMGDGVAVFDQYMRFRNDPRLTSLDLDDRIPICVVWNRHNRNPLIRLFADAMTALFSPAP